jgi:hypothetical protein
MKNLSGLVVFILVIGSALPAKAQDVTPKFEAYAGYDYMRDNATNDITHVPPSQSVNGNGGSGQLEFNATRWLVMPWPATDLRLRTRFRIWPDLA